MLNLHLPMWFRCFLFKACLQMDYSIVECWFIGFNYYLIILCHRENVVSVFSLHLALGDTSFFFSILFQWPQIGSGLANLMLRWAPSMVPDQDGELRHDVWADMMARLWRPVEVCFYLPALFDVRFHYVYSEIQSVLIS